MHAKAASLACLTWILMLGNTAQADPFEPQNQSNSFNPIIHGPAYSPDGVHILDAGNESAVWARAWKHTAGASGRSALIASCLEGSGGAFWMECFGSQMTEITWVSLDGSAIPGISASFIAEPDAPHGYQDLRFDFPTFEFTDNIDQHFFGVGNRRGEGYVVWSVPTSVDVEFQSSGECSDQSASSGDCIHQDVLVNDAVVAEIETGVYGHQIPIRFMDDDPPQDDEEDTESDDVVDMSDVAGQGPTLITIELEGTDSHASQRATWSADVPVGEQCQDVAGDYDFEIQVRHRCTMNGSLDNVGSEDGKLQMGFLVCSRVFSEPDTHVC